MVFPVLSVIWHSPSECTTHGTPQNNTALASTPNPYLFWAHSSMWGTSHLEIAIWCDFCGAFSWCCFLLRFLNLLWDSFLLCGNLSFTTPFTKQVYFLKTFVILFVFILCPTSFQGDWLPSLDIWSPPPAFTSCSLGVTPHADDLCGGDVLVGEKMVSPCYSSVILEPHPICRLFDEGHSDLCEMILHWTFDLHFYNNEWCWPSFHVFISHLYLFFGETTV